MGYGGLPNFTEYNAAGQVLLDGTLGKSVQDFRTYLSPWSGQPDELALGRRDAGLGRHDRGVGELERRHRSRLLAVLAGPSPSSLAPAATRREDGLPDDDRGARRRALRGGPGADSAGAVIGTSATVKD